MEEVVGSIPTRSTKLRKFESLLVLPLVAVFRATARRVNLPRAVRIHVYEQEAK